jgi:hypothetical protein
LQLEVNALQGQVRTSSRESPHVTSATAHPRAASDQAFQHACCFNEEFFRIQEGIVRSRDVLKQSVSDFKKCDGFDGQTLFSIERDPRDGLIQQLVSEIQKQRKKTATLAESLHGFLLFLKSLPLILVSWFFYFRFSRNL